MSLKMHTSMLKHSVSRLIYVTHNMLNSNGISYTDVQSDDREGQEQLQVVICSASAQGPSAKCKYSITSFLCTYPHYTWIRLSEVLLVKVSKCFVVIFWALVDDPCPHELCFLATL